MKLPKSGGVVARDAGGRQLEMQSAVRHYFYGFPPEAPLSPFSFDVPIARLQLYKIGGATWVRDGVVKSLEANQRKWCTWGPGSAADSRIVLATGCQAAGARDTAGQTLGRDPRCVLWAFMVGCGTIWA